MSLRDDTDCPGDQSEDHYHKTMPVNSEGSIVRNTVPEELEDDDFHGNDDIAEDPSEPKPPAKNKNDRRSYAERENSALGAQVSNLKRENARLEAFNTNSNRELVALRAKCHRLDNERLQWKEKEASWSRERKTLAANNNRAENEIINAKSRNDTLEEQKHKLQLECRDSELEKTNMKKHIRKLKDEKATLDEQIAGLNANQTELRNTINSLQQDKRALVTQMSILQNEQRSWRAEKAFHQNKFAEFKSANAKWADRNASLEQMVKDLQWEHSQKEEEITRLIEQGSSLAEEISGLRLQHLLDDDAALQQKFQFLHFAIRSWCVEIHDAKAPEQSAVFSQFPLAAPGSCIRLFDVADQEINVLIACTWEWMLKLIFGSTNVETGYHDSPDLWIDEGTAICLHNLELQLQTRDPKAVVEWRSLTVRQLAVDQPRFEHSRLDGIAAKIFDWTSECLHLDSSAESMVKIKQNLKNKVLARAIDFSLDLRRQYTVVWPQVPQILDAVIACHLGVREHDTSRKPVEVKICVRPQLRRLSLASMRGKLSFDNIVEAELSVLELPTQVLLANQGPRILPAK